MLVSEVKNSRNKGYPLHHTQYPVALSPTMVGQISAGRFYSRVVCRRQCLRRAPVSPGTFARENVPGRPAMGVTRGGGGLPGMPGVEALKSGGMGDGMQHCMVLFMCCGFASYYCTGVQSDVCIVHVWNSSRFNILLDC